MMRWLANSYKKASKTRLIGTSCLASLRIEIITETIFVFIGIVMFVKELIDWYIDYRIDKKMSDNNKKNRSKSRKDERH